MFYVSPSRLLFLVVLLFSGNATGFQTADRSSNAPTTPQLRAVINRAFQQTHDGYSSDEVILQTDLNQKFIAACQNQLPDTDAATFNWTLLNMRKAGALTTKATRRKPVKLDDVKPLAEIAARTVQDEYSVSTDRIMSDPELRKRFDNAVEAIDETVDLYRVRKAAFQLRKQRRLKPELITRIADWNRKISRHKLGDLKTDIDIVPEQPGIYIFHDETGYLYIGQSDDLRKRLTEHLALSSNFSLARHLENESQKSKSSLTVELHVFPSDSRAKEVMVRRAYESELIRSRKPRFNIQP